jgi:hypothetical protein
MGGMTEPKVDTVAVTSAPASHFCALAKSVVSLFAAANRSRIEKELTA